MRQVKMRIKIWAYTLFIGMVVLFTASPVNGDTGLVHFDWGVQGASDFSDWTEINPVDNRVIFHEGENNVWKSTTTSGQYSRCGVSEYTFPQPVSRLEYKMDFLYEYPAGVYDAYWKIQVVDTNDVNYSVYGYIDDVGTTWLLTLVDRSGGGTEDTWQMVEGWQNLNVTVIVGDGIYDNFNQHDGWTIGLDAALTKIRVVTWKVDIYFASWVVSREIYPSGQVYVPEDTPINIWPGFWIIGGIIGVGAVVGIYNRRKNQTRAQNPEHAITKTGNPKTYIYKPMPSATCPGCRSPLEGEEIYCPECGIILHR